MLIEIATHPALITAYREYMQVRSQARQGLIGGGAVAMYRERLRDTYRFLTGRF